MYVGPCCEVRGLGSANRLRRKFVADLRSASAWTAPLRSALINTFGDKFNLSKFGRRPNLLVKCVRETKKHVQALGVPVLKSKF